jgi:TolB-like protein
VLPFLIGYVAACFAIIEFVLNASETFTVPENTIKLLYILSAICIPVVILLPWYINRKKTVSGDAESGNIELHTQSDRTPIQDNSIIVLPFENISPDPDQEYFSDGLTEEIITDLSYINDLLVISRSSAMTFKGTNKTLKEITKSVNVRYALEGSVRKDGNNIRVVAQLIDGTNDTHIWAEKYNGTLEDIFNIQEEVSRSIADALKIKLNSLEKQKIDQRPIDNAFAYDCYKRAWPEINSMSEDRINSGLNLLQKGLEVNGENAVIYAGIALAYLQLINIGINAEENFIKFEEFTQKALNLDPELPLVHFALGGLKVLKDGEAQAAIDHWKQAHKSNPDDPEIMIYLALFLAFVGQNESAHKLVETIARIDPINPLCDAIRGYVHFFSGNYEKALNPLFASYKLTPESPMHQFWKALILFYNDRADEAFDLINEVVDKSSTNIWTIMTLLIKSMIKRDKTKLASLLTPEVVAQIQIDLQHSFHIATFYSYLEKKEEALKWLKNAVDRGFINYPLLNEQDILLENIRDEEGFKILMKRVKKEWEDYGIENL